MADIVVINVITPAQEPVEIQVTEDGSTDVEVSSVGEKGDPGEDSTPEGSLNYVIDAGNQVITTGLKGSIEWGFNALITGWSILADVVGDIVVDIWSDTYGNFPPTLADSITGTEKPSLSSAQKNQDLSLTSFNTSVTQGNIWAFNVDSVTSIKKVTIAFRFNKT